MELTKITDTLLMELQDKSDDPIYKEDPGVVWSEFKQLYPNYSFRNILSMKALLAGDVVIVHHSKNKFFLMLPSEDWILKAINQKIKEQNKRIREEQRELFYKMMRGDI